MYSPEALLYASSSNSTTSTTEQSSVLHPTEPDETSLPPLPYQMFHSNEMLNIRVRGIPSSGAKSRVETQIKLYLQLQTIHGQKVVGWSYIQLDKRMLARPRFRKNQHVMDGSVVTMVSDESKILSLEAKIMCSSNTDHPIRMCIGCVRREVNKKRAERSKSKETLVFSKDLEAERDRILLFNCPPMVNFSSGDAILPTRITCYCRHHNEKTGFRIQFEMKDYRGRIIATGTSPPIMITDDHKSLKQSSPKFKLSPNTTMLDYANANISQDHLFSLFPQNPDVEESLPAKENTIPVPQVDRLIPTEGPVYGGMDVTLLGSGFYRGLTCFFGEHPATTTFYNANTLVCVLPPATHAGTVVVSFRAQPFIAQETPLFTYNDASDVALYELALQVVGIKMTGKLHDPKQIAMHIVQGEETMKREYQQQWAHPDTMNVQSCMQEDEHTLLHLAAATAVLSYERLLKKHVSMYQHLSTLERLAFKTYDRNNKTNSDLRFDRYLESLELARSLVDPGAHHDIKKRFLQQSVTQQITSTSFVDRFFLLLVPGIIVVTIGLFLVYIMRSTSIILDHIH